MGPHASRGSRRPTRLEPFGPTTFLRPAQAVPGEAAGLFRNAGTAPEKTPGPSLIRQSEEAAIAAQTGIT